MATTADLTAELTAYKACRDAIISGAQSYEIAGRKVTKANLAEIRMGIQSLEQRIAIASGGLHGNVVFGGRP